MTHNQCVEPVQCRSGISPQHRNESVLVTVGLCWFSAGSLLVLCWFSAGSLLVLCLFFGESMNRAQTDELTDEGNLEQGQLWRSRKEAAASTHSPVDYYYL